MATAALLEDVVFAAEDEVETVGPEERLVLPLFALVAAGEVAEAPVETDDLAAVVAAVVAPAPEDAPAPFRQLVSAPA